MGRLTIFGMIVLAYESGLVQPGEAD